MEEGKKFSTLNDNALIDLALFEKSQKAWTELVSRYYGKVAATVYRIMGQTADSEDVVQEVFVEMAKSLKLYRRDSLFSTFLYRIAVNTAYRYIQRMMQKNELAETPEFFLKIGDSEQNAESALLKKERLTKINRALKNISPDKRFVLILYEVEGVPLKEIADILKQPLQTVWSRVNQAKKELYTIMSKEM